MSTVTARSAIRQALSCVGFQQLTVSGAAQALTVPRTAVQAVCQVQGDSVRFRIDGADPTSTVGIVLDDSDLIEINGASDLENFQVILDDAATDADIVCQYFG